MRFAFFNLVGASLLLLQSVFLFLKFRAVGTFTDAHWSAILVPLFVSLVLLIFALGGKIMQERHSNIKKDQEYDNHVSTTYLDVVAALFLLLAAIILSVHLHPGSPVPFYWVTTSLFVASLVWFIGAVIRFRKTDADKEDITSPEDPSKRRNISILVASLFLLQGLFLILMDGPAGMLFRASYWWIALPTLAFLIFSVYRTLVQTGYVRNRSTLDLVRQGAFLLFICVCMYGVAATIIHLEYPGSFAPEWIVLPFMVYSSGITLLFFCTTCVHIKTDSRYPERIYTPVETSNAKANGNMWPQHHFESDYDEMYDRRRSDDYFDSAYSGGLQF